MNYFHRLLTWLGGCGKKVLNVEVPKEAQYLRVIVMEMKLELQILFCNSILGLDTGAYRILYVFQFREKNIRNIRRNLWCKINHKYGKNWRFERDWTPKA
jgi:NADH-quinone oxidoreductase subunit D